MRTSAMKAENEADYKYLSKGVEVAKKTLVAYIVATLIFSILEH